MDAPTTASKTTHANTATINNHQFVAQSTKKCTHTRTLIGLISLERIALYGGAHVVEVSVIWFMDHIKAGCQQTLESLSA